MITRAIVLAHRMVLEGGSTLSLIMGVSIKGGTEWICAVPDFNAISANPISEAMRRRDLLRITPLAEPR